MPKHTLSLILLLPALLWAQDSLSIRDVMREAAAHHPQLKAAEARAQAATRKRGKPSAIACLQSMSRNPSSARAILPKPSHFK
jgi:hypothetical protein